MDNTQESPLTAISIGPGIRGIERGVNRVVRFREIAFVEREGFIIENLVAEMETSLLAPAVIWSDAKTFPAHLFRGKVNLLFAGYPCQPFSNAGQRKGIEDERHLYPYIERTVDVIRPDVCFFENVRGHITLGLREVVESLERMGYRVHFGIFSAEETGASHKRERVFIMAIRRDCLDNASGDRFESNDKVSTRRSRLEHASEIGVGQANSGHIRQRGAEYKPEKQQDEYSKEFFRSDKLANAHNSGERTRLGEVEGESGATEGEEQRGERHEVLGERMRAESGYCRFKQMGYSKSYNEWGERESEQSRSESIRRSSDERMGHTDHTRLQGRQREECGECTYQWITRANGPFARVARPGQPQQAWEHPRVISRKVESVVGLSAHGYNFREDVLRALGNSVYEDTAELAFRTLLAKFTTF